jgi:hypothetical protein
MPATFERWSELHRHSFDLLLSDSDDDDNNKDQWQMIHRIIDNE